MKKSAPAKIDVVVSVAEKDRKTKKKRESVLKEISDRVELGDYLGDGNAEVSRGRSSKMSLPFAEASVNATCKIKARCNLDEDTIHIVSKLLGDIVDHIVLNEIDDMNELLKDMQRMNKARGSSE